MSKILRRCLSLVLVVMLLASLTLGGTLIASADNKTGDGLAAHAMRAYNEGWVYSWGGASPGAVDCSGLIYGYVGSGERTTEGMLNASPESGYVSNGVPDIPGLGLWQPGHVGVYVGDGMAVDARDEISNVCYQSVATKSWVMWFKVDGVSYDTNSSVANDNQSDEDTYSSDIQDDSAADEPEYLSKGSTGSEVQALQERLKELGYFDEDTTQYFGSVTEAALIEFQTEAGLTPDGVYNDATEAALMSDNAPRKNAVTEEITDSEDDTLTDDGEETVNIPTADGEDSDSYSDSEDTLQEENSAQQNLEEEVSDETDTDKSGETSDSNSVVFTYGDSDSGVSNIQYILIKLGYYHGDMTGEYDEKTFNAVEFFQLDNDLPATGSVDEKTLNTMFAVFAEKFTQADTPAEDTVIEEQSDDTEIETETKINSEVETENEILPSAASAPEEAVTDSDDSTAETEAVSTDSETNEEISTDTALTLSTAQDSDADTEDTDTNTDTDSSNAVSGNVKTGGTATPTTDTSSLPKSPKTGDPITMSIQSAVEYIENYVNTTLVLIIIGISCIVIFFAGTVHYWNVSMEKRRQRARKATTVSVYRRSSM